MSNGLPINPFQAVKPRGADMPAKLPTKRKPAQPITIREPPVFCRSMGDAWQSWSVA